MTVLCLDVEPDSRVGRELHPWLGGAWALLFSNPEDFRLHRLRHQFNPDAVRTLTVKRDGGPGNETQCVTLTEPSFADANPISFAARTLRGELLTLRSRFVLLIDGSLKHCELLKYRVGRNAEIAPRLLAPVDALRYHHALGRAA
jgi:alkyl hydroperoxide reductase subunit AhpC